MQNVIGFFILLVILFGLLSMCSSSDSGRSDRGYRLVQASGNKERIVARGLSKGECEARKKDLKIVASTLGTGGSITCLPESLFAN